VQLKIPRGWGLKIRIIGIRTRASVRLFGVNSWPVDSKRKDGYILIVLLLHLQEELCCLQFDCHIITILLTENAAFLPKEISH
jgi:hypothetical protein